jgi:hypothetical protein
MMDYDCTNDVLEHRNRVAFWIGWLTDVLDYRAVHHDESKLQSPEKVIFDEYVPMLNVLEFGSDAYKSALEKMGEGLKHHYGANQHHPEHFPNGISGMTIWDLVEMLADWMAAASVKNDNIDLSYLQERFNISPQLMGIIANTLYAADMESINCRIPPNFWQIKNFLSNENFPVFIEAKKP